MNLNERLKKGLAYLAYPLWRVLRYCDRTFTGDPPSTRAPRDNPYGFQAVGEDCVISSPVYLSHQHKIRIGARVSMAPCVFLAASDGAGIEIGDDTMIAAFAVLCTATHDYRVRDMRSTGVNESIVIGKGCWIGLKAIILPGVTIGDGAVVGAGAVVTRDVEPNAIVVGVPARLLKYRDAGGQVTSDAGV
jgi:maltose O-acetyltransferase